MQIEFTLRRKRDEIEAAIHAYEAKIEAARTDLAAVEATIRLFDPEARCHETAMGSEPRKILAARPKTFGQPGRLDTRQLPLPVAKAKRLAILFRAVRILKSVVCDDAQPRPRQRQGEWNAPLKGNGISLRAGA